jgi:hypothetical protein
MSDPWTTLLVFVASVVLLYLLQRWISRHVQGIGMLAFGSPNAGMGLLWFLLLPGTLVHEFSHWVMAKLLGLKTGRFRIAPEFKGKEVILGSVEIQKTNAFADSLVGLAPFLGGTLVLLAIGYLAFDMEAMVGAWESREWQRVLGLAGDMLQVPDSWLWLYLVVAVSNAMMPSPSDRKSWRLVLMYLGLVVGALLVLGWLPVLPSAWIEFIITGMRSLTYAFAMTLVIDLGFALAVALAELILVAVSRRRVVYK